MPFPRPVSPITFETCPPTTDDIAYDDLLGSDDELDEDGRAAKRRRVERLAGEYLRGNALFIFSASLRGPFEGWRNPWRRERGIPGAAHAGAGAGETGFRENGVGRNAEPVVEETGSRPKYRGDLERLRDPSADGSVVPTSPAVQSQGNNSVAPRSGQKRPMQPAEAEQDRALPRSTKKLKETSSYGTDDQTILEAQTVDWLKKDRKRMNFGNFEPPSSPTPKIGTRHDLNKSRRSASRTVEARISKSIPRNETPRGSATPESVETTPQSARMVVPAAHIVPEGTGQSLGKEQVSPKQTAPQVNSFRVMSSTSQLPRFEFRRWDHKSSSRGSPRSPHTEMGVEAVPVAAVEDHDGNLPVSDAPEECHGDVSCNGPHADDQLSRQSRSLRFADASTSGPADTSPQAATEGDTCENLPSAQQVSAPHEILDRIPSLHSTAMPKTDTAPNTASSPVSQLSTQAALLHAQKSFQDDLESPGQNFGLTPGQDAASPAADVDHSVLLANETPYPQPNITEKALLRSSKQAVKDRMQAMSTQCMLDAATPYTFSTEKKPNAYRTISPHHTDIEKPRSIPIQQGLPAPSEATSPSPEIEYQTAQSSAGGSSPRGVDQPPDQPPTHRSTTQGTALPFTLSESTPTTAQDGQGGLQGAESFNLSQAIAEAGSWLQQSFDFSERDPAVESAGLSGTGCGMLWDRFDEFGI